MGSNTRPRNKYTRQLQEPIGRDQPCEECTWWDKRGNCVLCGQPKPPRLEMRRTVGLVDKDGNSADYDYPVLHYEDEPPVEKDCTNYREYGLVCERGAGHKGNCGPTMLPSVLHVCGLAGFAPMKDDCPACATVRPPNPSHRLTDNELALRNKRRQ